MENDNKAIGAVSSFIKRIMDLSDNGMEPTAFRGHKCDSWDALPSIFRHDYTNAYKNENSIVRDIVSAYPTEFESDKTMFDRLVRMQHYALPTRLLDVTINPLVSLWFATEEYTEKQKTSNGRLKNINRNGKVFVYFVPSERRKYYDSDTVSCLANLSNLKDNQKTDLLENAFALANEDVENDVMLDVFNNNNVNVEQLHYQIGMEKPHFRNIINPKHFLSPVYVKPKMSNKRIVAQSGAFLIYPAHPDKTKNHPGNDLSISTMEIVIQASAKKKIRKQLEKLGIHAGALFPEMDKASEYILAQYHEGVS